MNELICEMCGSNNIIKQDGLYVCQSCGTKYSVEEARKMMTGETVEVEGTVKIDSSTDLQNLYEIARRAKDTNNSENGLKYYNEILLKDPNSWEAQFYVVYFRAMQGKYAEIVSLSVDIANTIPAVLKLVKDNVDVSEQDNVINELYERCFYISSFLNDIAHENVAVTYEIGERKRAIVGILFSFGDGLNEIFGNKYIDISLNCWKTATQWLADAYHQQRDSSEDRKIVEFYTNKIQESDPNYEKPKGGSCYVATCVYGSYDCPEVWTLRRFRDNNLKQSFFGRTFIKCYYATSPTIVKYFGDYKIFNSIFKPILDKFVNKLQEYGIPSTIYIDE